MDFITHSIQLSEISFIKEVLKFGFFLFRPNSCLLRQINVYLNKVWWNISPFHINFNIMIHVVYAIIREAHSAIAAIAVCGVPLTGAVQIIKPKQK